MALKQMSGEDVGRFFTKGDDEVWQMISYCDRPTATLRNIVTGECVGGAPPCLNLSPFMRLIVEEDHE